LWRVARETAPETSRRPPIDSVASHRFRLFRPEESSATPPHQEFESCCIWDSVKSVEQPWGGYAAVKFSRLFRATQVISLCPQWSIDFDECEGTNPGWQEHFYPYMKGMGIRDGDVCGDVFLFADSFNKADMFHCKMIERAYPNAYFINVLFVGHHVTTVFAGTISLLNLIDSCRSGNIAGLRLFSRHVRKRHILWQEAMINNALSRFPKIFYSRLFYKSGLDATFMHSRMKYFIGILDHILQHNCLDEALTFFYNFRNLIREPNKGLLACALIGSASRSQVVIETAHKTPLMYSLDKDKCCHKSVNI
jgi:hypothetical protein